MAENSFDHADDYDQVEDQDILEFRNLNQAIKKVDRVMVLNISRKQKLEVHCKLTSRQRDILLAGGLINLLHNTLQS